MAEQIGTPISATLAQRLQLRNRGNAVPYFLQQNVVPVVNWDPERDDVSEFFTYASGAVVGPIAAQNPHIFLSNPLGSGVVGFLDTWRVTKTTAGEVVVLLCAAGLGALSNVGFATRLPTPGGAALQAKTGALQWRTQTAAGFVVASATLFGTQVFTANQLATDVLPHPIRIDPGMAVYWHGPTVNELLRVWGHYREYPENLVAE